MFSCRYDTVKLTDSLGQEITDPLSGPKARFYVTVEGKNTQLLNITFTSDSSTTKRGFLAQFGTLLSEYPCFKVPRQLKYNTGGPDKVFVCCTHLHFYSKCMGFTEHFAELHRLSS